jgi:dipeptidyl-peptidase-3
MGAIMLSCDNHSTKKENMNNKPMLDKTGAKGDDFRYLVEQFGDIKIMRFKVPGFEELSLQEKELIYYLSQAALSGRDIIWDQNYKYNLLIRKTLEEIYKHYEGDRGTDEFKAFEVYLKKVWFANGIHHHYSMDKFNPDFTPEYFTTLIRRSTKAHFPVQEGQEIAAFVQHLTSLIFDPEIAPKRLSLDDPKDMIKASACNFYANISQKEAEAYYEKMKKPGEAHPVAYGLNSKLIKKNGSIEEQTYKVGGLYTQAIERIVFWLKKAEAIALSEIQKSHIQRLISFYETGSLKTFDEYSILWSEDTLTSVDFVNGFIETYGDPLGLKGSWESLVNFKNMKATRRAEIVSENAQWFEDHSPVAEQFKKKTVKGVSAKVITAAQLGGDTYPSTPIGINLPNSDWIRKEHGSKSVSLENITDAYEKAAEKSGFKEEFYYSQEEIDMNEKYGSLAGKLHTDLHEILGHGSGQLLAGTSADALKNHSSTLEEARADLFALYYLIDPKLVELHLIPSTDLAKAEYYSYILNGLMGQLKRVELGKNIEESHMRNRQLIAKWVYEKGKADNVIEMFKKDGKTQIKINDYQKLRDLFGKLLAEVQRIKSEGDYEAGKKLVEDYAVKVDRQLHQEVLARFEKLNIAPYGGFINPVFELVKKEGKIIDVKIEYPMDFAKQNLKYSEEYSFLPLIN